MAGRRGSFPRTRRRRSRRRWRSWVRQSTRAGTRAKAAGRCHNGMATPTPPIEPLLAAGDLLYEPKWDGFRALVFRDAGGVYIQSRELRPLDRYFPDLHEMFVRALPGGCVLDGEIVIAGRGGLDFDALQMRLHPA